MTTSNGAVMSISITREDMNAIKTAQFATSYNDTFVSFTSVSATDTLCFDLKGNKVNEINSTSALQVGFGKYTGDQVHPQLLQFSFYVESGDIELLFDEPIQTQAVNFSKIVLQSDINGIGSWVRLVQGTILTTTVMSASVRLQ